MSTATSTSDGSSQLRAPSDLGATFVVYRQPIALDRFTVHDVLPPDTAPAVSVTASSNKPSSLYHPPRSAARDQQRASSGDHGQNSTGVTQRSTLCLKKTSPFLLL